MIPEAKLKDLYAAMLKYRMLEERFHAGAPSRAGKRTAYRPSGLEAAAAGALLDLRREDWFAPSPRSIPASFLKNVPAQEVLAQLRRLSSPAATQAKPPSPSAPILDTRQNIIPAVASTAVQLSVAAGVALALQARKKGSIVVVFCEDAARRSWIDALSIAAFHCLPLVVVAHGGSSSQGKTTTQEVRASKAILVPEAHFCHVPLIPVDAADVVALYRVAFESINKARHGGGPTLIEAQRFDLPLPGAPEKAGRPQPDAIGRMEEYLTAKGLFSSRIRQKQIDRFAAELGAFPKELKGQPSFGSRDAPGY